MPCTYEEGPLDYLQKDLKAATQAACDLAKVVKDSNLLEKLQPSTRIWIEKHEKLDQARKKTEEENNKIHINHLKNKIKELNKTIKDLKDFKNI